MIQIKFDKFLILLQKFTIVKREKLSNLKLSNLFISQYLHIAFIISIQKSRFLKFVEY